MTTVRKLSLSRWRRGCALISLLGAATVARAFEEPEESSWLTFRRSEGYLSLDAAAEQDNSGSSKGGNTTVNRIYLDPVLGIGVDGSLYHPDLLSFSLKPEFQYVWQQVGSVGGSASTTTSWMPGGTGTFTWLQTKPY